jgi:hypothetical protein
MIKNSLIGILAFLGYSLSNCNSQAVENTVEYYGAYELTTIEQFHNVDTYFVGIPLRIGKDGKVRFPLGIRPYKIDTAATWQVLEQDSVYIFRVASCDSTTNGDWIISDQVTSTYPGGGLYVDSFTIENNFYRISLNILLRFRL